jgi:hypothetical protein
MSINEFSVMVLAFSLAVPFLAMLVYANDQGAVSATALFWFIFTILVMVYTTKLHTNIIHHQAISAGVGEFFIHPVTFKKQFRFITETPKESNEKTSIDSESSISQTN